MNDHPEDPTKDPLAREREAPEDEVAPTDPAHRAALVLMVSAPLILGAAVFLLLKLVSG